MMIRRLLLGGTTATLAAMGMKAYSNRIVRKATEQYPPIGEFVTVEGVTLHYLAVGMGQPVVFLHASGVVLQDFTLSIFDRVAASYQAIVFDRPGYGYSDQPADQPLSVGLNARLIHDALASRGVERPILVGHSYGGAVALNYALEYPSQVAGLVLLAPSAYAEGFSVFPMFYIPDIPLLGWLFLHMVWPPLARMGASLFYGGMFAPDSPPDIVVKTMAGFAVRRTYFRALAAEVKRLPRDLRRQSRRYEEIRIPVVIVTGEADQVDPPEQQAYRLHRAIPHSQLITLEETGHVIHYGHPHVVMDAIAQVHLKAQSW
jgi:pimeloyl-ACP methyl ester carboxylesterase